MVSTSTERYYSGTAIILELTVGTMVCCVSALALIGYFKCHGWKKPSGLIVMNLLAADLINGIISPLQAAYIHCLLHDIKAADLFRTILFLQALFLWASPVIVILLNISRLLSILDPFQYSSIVTQRSCGIMLVLAWLTGLVDCFLKRYWVAYAEYKYFAPDVVLHLIFSVIILGLALYTIIVLNVFPGQTQCESRARATKTVIIVSLAFFLTDGYYIYVYIVWMIPGLPQNTENQWLRFTAIGKWSLSIAHLMILMNSLFNGVIFGLQPYIRRAIENIWVPNYYRYKQQQEAIPTTVTTVSQ